MNEPNAIPPWIPPAMAEPEGFVGLGGDLKPDTLYQAYSDGVFPWFNEGDPILWWSPDPRAIIELDSLHVSRSLTRTIRSGRFTITRDRAFRDVVTACAETRAEGTWITPAMIAAYHTLHQRGIAHSLETWIPTDAPNRTDAPPGAGWKLAGGIYGVAIGAFFAGESMFHFERDASKVALVALVEHLRQKGFLLFDVQMRTDHTTRMGAVEISRAAYLRRLRAAIKQTHILFA
ncbi:MAG: leucyl/phenylalanyl-tRNA--protein transferase [Bacteroidales bacterium]|nr:leucyl/phenylalanyl-tRNA--protein transferase [Bacteroidales bacterium]